MVRFCRNHKGILCGGFCPKGGGKGSFCPGVLSGGLCSGFSYPDTDFLFQVVVKVLLVSLWNN